MRSLVAVAEYGSITEAASAIGLSQSALSRRMAQLEGSLEAQLLERRGHGIALTSTGQLVLEEAQVMVQRYERLRRRVQEHLALESGVVRIGGGATAVAFALPQAIAAFRRQHPSLVFQVREAGSLEIESAVRRDILDLGVVTSPVRSGELKGVPWLRDEILLVAARQHPLSSQKRVEVSELQGQNLIGFEAGTAVRRLIDSALRAAGVEPHVMMELRSVGAILRMVESTGSLAFVSELAVSRRRQRGGPAVEVVPLGGLRVERQLSVVCNRDRALSPAAAAFAETLLTSRNPAHA